MNFDSSWKTCYVSLVPIDVHEEGADKIVNLSNADISMSSATDRGTSNQVGTMEGNTGLMVTPCVLCGTVGYDDEGRPLNLDDILVKREVEVPTTNDSGDEDNADFPATTASNSQDNDDIPPIVQSLQNQVSRLQKWTEEENHIFQCFIKWFKLKLTSGTKKVKQVTNFGWDGDTGKEPFPFCIMCKGQLMELLEFERKVDELQKKIKNVVEELKQKANTCEDVFGRNNIYEKDQRYQLVRKQFVEDFWSRYSSKLGRRKGHMPSKNLPNKRQPSRRGKGLSEIDSLNSQPPAAQLSTSTNDNDKFQLQLPVIKTEDNDDVELDNLIAEAMAEQTMEDVEIEIPETDFLSDRDNANSDSSEPVTRRRKSTRKRKSVSRNKDGFVPFEDDDNEFLDDDNEGYWTIKKSSGCPPRATASSLRKPKRIRKDLRDEEWTNDKEAKAIESEEDDDNCVDDARDADINKGKLIFDSEKRTLTYRNVVFHHQEPYSGTKYKCFECDVVVNAKSSSVRGHYLRNHTDLFVCKQCNYHASSTGHLSQHIKTVHEGRSWPKPRLIECPVCLRPQTKAHLKGHLWTHKSQEEKDEAIARGDECVPTQLKVNHQCDQCGKSFRCNSDLRKHKQTVHANEESRQSQMELCPICGGTYLHLKSHQRLTHGVGGKEFKCLEPGCGRVFVTLFRLTKHKDVVHRKIREFKCTLCPRQFAKPRGLQNHMNSHNGIRPWKCQFCSNAFIYKSNLERHVESFHAEGSAPRRKSFVRGPCMLPTDIRKKDLIKEGKYLPPSALATWAAGREPTSHFPLGTVSTDADSNVPVSSSTSTHNI